MVPPLANSAIDRPAWQRCCRLLKMEMGDRRFLFCIYSSAQKNNFFYAMLKSFAP
jgi:hypothetical protein